MRRLRDVLFLVKGFWLVVLVGCSGAAPREEAPAAETPSVESSEIPETPAGDRFRWAFGVMNGESVDIDAIESRFSAGFLEVVPAEAMVTMLTELARDTGPFEVWRVEPEEDPTRLSVLLRNDEGTPVRVDVRTSDEEPYRILGFSVRGALYLDPTLPATWSEIEASAREIAPATSLMAAEITDGTCVPVFESDRDRSLAIGSAFKLYVLGALVQGIQEGRLSWDETLPVHPEWRSMSSLELREVPDGTPLTLLEYARPMIRISDNTATDHLLHHVGREAVEAEQVAMGHSHPELNQPFLSTREMFLIKMLFTPDQRQAYVAGGSEERRAMVEMTADMDLGLALWASLAWNTPLLIDQVEWFASAADLCRAMVALREMAGTEAGEPIRGILAENPGTGFDTERWPYVGYKGGSEPGVLNFTWLLRRDDDRWFVLSMGFNNPEAEIDEDAALRLAVAAVNLLAQ